MTEQKEVPQEESTTFVRPPKKKDWRLICIRIGVIAAATVLICLFVLRPMVINGESMMPTYSSRGFTFAFLPYFKMYDPQRHQIVILKHAGFNTFLLKRVLAFPGETVEFRDGVLYVNGRALDEPYVKNGCSWSSRGSSWRVTRQVCRQLNRRLSRHGSISKKTKQEQSSSR